MLTVSEPVEVVIRDGSTIHIRPARFDDYDAVCEFYRRLSPESRYSRFFGKPHMEEIVDHVVREVDSPTGVALLTEIDGKVVAIGQYLVIPGSPQHAEVAFAIADEYQGLGIGTQLLERLATIARTRGVTTFEAYLLSTNIRMHEVFANARFPVTWNHPDGTVTHAVLSLSDGDRHTAGIEQ